MKKFLSVMLVIVLCLSMLCISASAKVVDTGLTVNGTSVTLSTHIEYANGNYYISTKELTPYGFNASQTQKEYILTRYNTELRVEKSTSKVFINGVTSTFENGVILGSTNGTYYVASGLLANAFCTQHSATEDVITISLEDFQSSATKSLTGTISLASGTAPAEMEYSVSAVASEVYTTTVKIPAGSSSVSYTLPIQSTDTNFVIRCRQLNASSVTGYTETSYYSYKGTVSSVTDASSVGIAASANANFTISKTKTVTGNISGNGNGYLLVTNNEGDVIGSTDFYSSSSSSYSVTIPGETTNAYLRYKIYDGDNAVQYGYFASDGTSAYESDASAVNTSNVLDMNILTGKTISGSLTWNDASATSCTIGAMTADGKFVTDTNVYTTADSTFAIAVPDTSSEYVLIVETNDNGFTKYVSNSGLTTKLSEAAVYNVASGNVASAAVVIDSTATANVLHGQLVLPDGLVATKDIPVTVYAGTLSKNTDMSTSAYSIANQYNTTATILTGTNSVDYSLDLGSYNGEKIALAYMAGGAAYTNGYFDGDSATTFSVEKDISFDASEKNNINLYVVTESNLNIAAIKDASGADYTSGSANKNTVVVTLENLTNIDKSGKVFIGAYDNVNALVASGVASYTVDGSAAGNITVNIDGNMANVKFLKIFTLDTAGKLVARDIVIL